MRRTLKLEPFSATAQRAPLSTQSGSGRVHNALLLPVEQFKVLPVITFNCMPINKAVI
jgi:hypothetical protein